MPIGPFISPVVGEIFDLKRDSLTCESGQVNFHFTPLIVADSFAADDLIVDHLAIGLYFELPVAMRVMAGYNSQRGRLVRRNCQTAIQCAWSLAVQRVCLYGSSVSE